jgi:CDP-glucose 4,6-dehydratase
MWNNPESYNSAWNFGPDNDDNISVEEIAKSCIEHWGKGSYKTVCGANLHEARLLNLDISKARYYLKWKPLLKAKEALLDTVLWYKAFYSGYVDMYQYTIEQIDKYVAKASESG